MARKNAVHYDVGRSDGPLRFGLCGVSGAVETDISKVTCKMCQARFVAGNKRPKREASFSASAQDVSQPFAKAYADLLDAPGMPPKHTPQLAASMCRGTMHNGEYVLVRCRRCELCEYEADVERYAYAAPWATKHVVRRGGHAWLSLNAALRAWALWKQEGPLASSAQGLMLDKVRDGTLGSNQSGAKGEDMNLERAGDLARVEQALALAYPEGGHAKLTATQCKTLLLDRTPGVRVEMPSYEERAEELGVGVGELKAIVKHGRTVMYEDLLGRGMIPRAVAKKPKPAVSRMVAEAEGW